VILKAESNPVFLKAQSNPVFGHITEQRQCPNLGICSALHKLSALRRFSECYKTAKGRTMAIKKHTFHTRFQGLINEQMALRPPSSGTSFKFVWAFDLRGFCALVVDFSYSHF
jgi:hypothetical protein